MSYDQWTAMSDAAILEKIGLFIQWHRLGQNKTQEEVAAAAGMSRSTLSLLERGKKVRIDTLIQAMRVLNVLHVLDNFSVREVISPLEYAKQKQGKRKQASPGKRRTEGAGIIEE